jgi:TRAP-type C4-dicarboxylate transport system permease large subunit
VAASIYALFLGTVVYRELRWGDLSTVLWDSAKQTVQVMFIIASAAPFGWVLIQQQIPNAIINAILGISSTPWVVLLMVNAILLVMGMFIEGIAIMIITFPIFVPLVQQVHVDPTHFGVIVVLNLMIGGDPTRGYVPVRGLGDQQRDVGMFAEMWPYMASWSCFVVTYAPGL